MQAALTEARHAQASGDVPVGAVVLGNDDGVLARAHNCREIDHDPTAHAEIVALRAAASAQNSWHLDGATVVVTLEPCAMCAGALVLARVARVVYGTPDPKAGAAGSLWDLLRDRRLNHRPEVIGGVLADSCATILDEFFDAQRDHESQ
ncbi:nucleoside deaminase [Actinobacteria bacterium YIM 96077]|uniref:tRNA-specific adenosine deaminase n=2 Tax=Phytoactinopolyspora halophila TaxID=1981511 RepID=A0A329QF03_9ACTN|nr:nucleoside deaminase [Actinobacteria bacterium YIM 96077]RAW09852.1 nucleoside deaminase [Phytoactinopolyspora halophila]